MMMSKPGPGRSPIHRIQPGMSGSEIQLKSIAPHEAAERIEDDHDDDRGDDE